MRLIATLFLVALTPHLRAQDSKAFQGALEEVQEFIERGRWTHAESSLMRALDEHAEAGYVLEQRELVLEYAKRIAFAVDVGPADLDQLVMAEVHYWKPGRKNKIHIEYDSSNSWSEWEKEDDFTLHPLVFTGPLEIEFSGRAYPRDEPPVLVFYDADVQYHISLGTPSLRTGVYFQPTILRVTDQGQSVVAQAPASPARAYRPYSARLKMTSQKVIVEVNEKEILEAKRKRGDAFGQFGFENSLMQTHLESFSLKGEVNSSWAGNLIDAQLQRDREHFDAFYDPKERLPDWLFVDELAPIDPGAARLIPKPFDQELHAVWIPVEKAIETGRTQRGLTLLQAVPVEELPACHRSYLACVLYYQLGDYERALEECRKVVLLDPEFLQTRLIEARLVQRMSFDESFLLYQAIAEDFVYTPRAVTAYLEQLLLDDQIEAAVNWVDRFVEQHPRSQASSAAQRLLLKAESGPVYSGRSTSYKTKHFAVYSDMNRDICAQAAKDLERMYRAYNREIRKLPEQRDQRFRVYLFSGRAGFERYADDALGGSIHNAAGLYSPILKQLLIWNAQDHDEMFRTVKHEGFHQYFDQLMDDPPIWLNEGMASYFEHATYTNDTFVEGQVDRNFVRLLEEEGLVSLRDLIRMDSMTFMNPAHSTRNYAQSWAFVHFLRNSTDANRALLERLIDELCSSQSSQTTIQSVFADVDLEELEAELNQHLSSLTL